MNLAYTLDAYTSSASGFTYSINLAHASTGLPSNVDDEDIVDGQPLRPQSMDQPTRTTYHIAKIQFIHGVRNFVDAVNCSFPNSSYETILELDKALRATYEGIPAPLRQDLPQPLTLRQATTGYLAQQRLFVGITLHNRLMRLHRAYMVNGYTDELYAYSTQVCVESAYALLDLVALSRRELLLWWVVLVHVWTAALVLAADMFRATENTDRQRMGIDLAISLLK